MLSTTMPMPSSEVTQSCDSFDYEMLDYRVSDPVKVDILVKTEVGK